MAFVPKSVHDVFISYAHADNQGSSWVTHFRDELERELSTELTLWGGRRVAVWHDLARLKPGYTITNSIREALQRTSVVLSLWSPGYLASGYCAEEVATFQQACGGRLIVNTQSRLIDALIRPAPAVLAFLKAQTRPIYADLSDNGWPAALDNGPFQQPFRGLVGAIAELLRAMRDQWPAVYVGLPSAGNAAIERCTAELLEDLSQAGYRRTPEIHPAFYGTDADLEAEMEQGLLSIHLLDDGQDALALRQVHIAQRRSQPMVVWFSPAARADRSGALDAIRRSGCEYSDESFSEFVEHVKRKLDVLRAPQTPAPAVPPDPTVFVLFHPRADAAAASSVMRRIEAERFNVVKPGRGADRVIKESDGVLLYQRHATDEWFDSKLRTVGAAPAVKGVCVVNPPAKDRSKAAASDFKFRDVAGVDRDDPRLLLENDAPDTLAHFLQFVRERAAVARAAAAAPA